MRSLPSVLTLLFVVLASACDQSPIVWSDPTPIKGPPPAERATRLILGDIGAPRLVVDSAAVIAPPGDSTACKASLRTARGQTRLWAVWWAVRPDSSASLDAASSTDDGRTWTRAVPVDSTDKSSNGCDRPAASIATSGDDPYIAYSMVAPEGTGVFFSHYMDGMFHSPVAVIYGERLVAAALAVEGNRVVVAYEEPNGTRRQVDVALSATQGHIFESHTTASRDIDGATNPMVALRGSRLAVAWLTSREGDTTVTRIVREGTIR